MRNYFLSLTLTFLLTCASAYAQVCSDGKTIKFKRDIISETMNMQQRALDEFLAESNRTSLPDSFNEARQRMTNAIANVTDKNAGNCENVGQDQTKVDKCCRAIDAAQVIIDEVAKKIVVLRRVAEVAPNRPLPPSPPQKAAPTNNRYARVMAPLKVPTAEQKAAVQRRVAENRKKFEESRQTSGKTGE